MKFELGQEFDLGNLSFSEQEIMDFARAYDPLDFHLDKKAAAASIFGTLIASGPHLFNTFYKTKWLALFKDTILAGMELNNWKLLLPVYPEKKYFGKVKITELRVNEKRKHATLTWHFLFTNEDSEIVQSLYLTILHKL